MSQNPTPLQRLLMLLQDADPNRLITLLTPAQIEDLSTAVRQVLSALHSAELSPEQRARLSGLSVNDAMALLDELARALPACPQLGQELDVQADTLKNLLGLLLQLSALGRNFASIYEGADAAMLACTSRGDQAVAQTLDLAQRVAKDDNLAATLRQNVIANSSALAQQRQDAQSSDGAAPADKALPEQAARDEQAATQAFLDAVRAGRFAPARTATEVAAAPAAATVKAGKAGKGTARKALH